MTKIKCEAVAWLLQLFYFCNRSFNLDLIQNMLSLIKTFIAMKCWSSQQEMFENSEGILQ